MPWPPLRRWACRSPSPAPSDSSSRVCANPTCHPGRPGYVYLPAMAAIVVASVLSAPAGAKLAHRWPAAKLRRAFAALLYALGGYMLWKAIRG